MGVQGAEFPTFESFKVWFDEKTKQHPFKIGRIRGRFLEDFIEGKVPVEFLREWVKQFYVFIELTNTNGPWALVNYLDLCRKHPEFYELMAAKIGSEIAEPAPGGHGRTFVKFARYFGVRDEDLFNVKPTIELESRFNLTLLYRSQSCAQTAVRWMLEGFVGYQMKRNRDVLHDRYHVPDEVLEYFDIHIQADLEEHGPEGEIMLANLYKLRLVREEDYNGMRAQVESAVAGANPGSQTYTWADALYERYLADHSPIVPSTGPL
jgi:pyrroloquinoline quinone (PQQ) biosynthesis protein C